MSVALGVALVACSGEHGARPAPAVAITAARRLPPLPALPPIVLEGSALPATTVCEPLKDLGQLIAIGDDATVPAIVDEGSQGMAHFYARLAELVRGKATDHVRIGFFGDSNTASDFLTGELRRVLQKKFGDGGHGFVALAHHPTSRAGSV